MSFINTFESNKLMTYNYAVEQVSKNLFINTDDISNWMCEFLKIETRGYINQIFSTLNKRDY